MDVKKKKKVCKYGAKCYRKNRAHRREYSHYAEDTELQDKNKLTCKTDELQKKKPAGNNNAGGSQSHKTTSSVSQKRKRSSKKLNKKWKKAKRNEGAAVEINEEKKTISNSSQESDSETDLESTSWVYVRVPVDDRSEIRIIKWKSAAEKIKLYYLVDMPPDFFSFFKFCESVNKSDPLNALKSFGLILVGPFEISAGKNVNIKDKSLMVCHWRYYYDPPEFQTVLASESGFHMGYWRDDPREENPFVASNTSEECSFKTEGGNIFGAVYNYLTEFIKTSDPFLKTEAGKFQALLGRWADEYNYSLEKFPENVINRRKKINSKTFHGLGIVVPVQKRTEVGYRPLIESDANLKNICHRIIQADNVEVEETLMDSLQPLITFANIANDECDFGNSLELGIDLFCMGSSVFHCVIEHLLVNSYNLLRRYAFGEIIKIHLRNRKKGTNMSVL